jgi:hypothetical protein
MKIELHVHIHNHDDDKFPAAQLRALTQSISLSRSKLLTAAGKPSAQPDKEKFSMKTPGEILDEMTAEVAALTTAVDSNTALVAGLRAALAQAIADAKAAGLTEEQVAGFQALHDKIAEDKEKIVAASVENVPEPANP